MNLDGKTICIIGDSLSVGRVSPGVFLRGAMMQWAKPKEVIVVGVGGMALSYFRPSYIKHYIKYSWARKAMTQLTYAKSTNADVYFVMLGTNDYLAKSTQLLDAASNLITELKKGRGLNLPDVYFIGPPSFLPQLREGTVYEGIKRFYATMQGIVAKGLGVKIFDTRPQSADLVEIPKDRPDGIHFSKHAAQTYATRIMHLLQGVKMGGPGKTQSPFQLDKKALGVGIGLYLLARWLSK